MLRDQAEFKVEELKSKIEKKEKMLENTKTKGCLTKKDVANVLKWEGELGRLGVELKILLTKVKAAKLNWPPDKHVTQSGLKTLSIKHICSIN
ncbi:MAG: hypothetical protein SGPRY_001050 [Prymnesium sp.]